MKLSDGNWFFFYALEWEAHQWVVMRHKEDSTPLSRCLELYVVTGRKAFPVRVHVKREDRLNWVSEKVGHLVKDHLYGVEDAMVLLG